MTPIATKNNAIILKDGSIAEGCECCGVSCDNLPPYLRLTVNGMPRSINSGVVYGYSARSAFDDNGATYTLYPATNPSTGYCQYKGGPHGHVNVVGFTSELWAWTLDLANNILYGYGRAFVPPAGASFRLLPYSDARPLIVLSSYYNQFGNDFGTDADWSNVVVSIEVGKSTTTQFACFPDSTCTPQDIQEGATTACTSVSDGVSGQIADLPLQVQVSGSLTKSRFANPYAGGQFSYNDLDETIDVSFLSGSYDAAWMNDSRIFIGGFSPAYAAPEGSQAISQGYRFNSQVAKPFSYQTQRSPASGGFSISLTQIRVALAVRPTAFRWTSSTPGGVAQLSRCGNGQVSWGVHCVLLYPNGQVIAQFYKPVECSRYECGQPPSSLSVSGTVEVSLTSNFGTEIIGDVQLTVSG